MVSLWKGKGKLKLSVPSAMVPEKSQHEQGEKHLRATKMSGKNTHFNGKKREKYTIMNKIG